MQLLKRCTFIITIFSAAHSFEMCKRRKHERRRESVRIESLLNFSSKIPLSSHCELHCGYVCVLERARAHLNTFPGTVISRKHLRTFLLFRSKHSSLCVIIIIFYMCMHSMPPFVVLTDAAREALKRNPKRESRAMQIWPGGRSARGRASAGRKRRCDRAVDGDAASCYSDAERRK